MASMYDPIRDYLKFVVTDIVTLTYEEINSLIKKHYPNKELPRTAYKKLEWWSNNSLGHTQCISWNSARWNTTKVNLGYSVTFKRF